MRNKHYRKLIYLATISILLAISSSTASIAEPPPFPEDILKLVPFETLFNFGVKCEGKSDLPHISRHKPGTVNVQARTTCPSKGVEITSRLTRTFKGEKFSVTKSNEGMGRATVYVSMQCVWKRGMRKIHYEVGSVHRLADGQVGYTYNYADLEC